MRHQPEHQPAARTRTYVHAKLHGVTATDAAVAYYGSVTIGNDLMAASGIEPYEQVDVVNLNTGGRWTTYALPGPDGVFTLNGGGARLGVKGDPCVVMAYESSTEFHGARVVFCAPRTLDGGALVNDIINSLPYPSVEP